MNRKRIFRTVAMAGLTALSSEPGHAADARHLTLTEAVHLAISQNRAVKIAKLKVVESGQKKADDHADYFPRITNQSNVLHVTELENITLPAGAFGIAAGAFIPPRSISIGQGQNTLVSSGTQITQPLTQLIRIHAANRIAEAEVAASRDDLRKIENDVALQAHALYYGILITRLEKEAAEQQRAYAGEHLHESEEEVRNGSALNVSAIQGRAALLESQQSLLTADLRLSDLTTELNDLLGLPLDTKLDLDPAVPTSFNLGPREEYVQSAWSEKPEILAAEEAVKKARAGVAAAKSAYIPDITAFARQSYQNGVPFLVHNFGTFGLNLSYDLFDFGKRRAAVREREAQLAQAEENLTRLKEQAVVVIEKSYNKLERTKNLVQVADQIVKLRQESERVVEAQVTEGVLLVSDRRQSRAATYRAEADYLQASLGYLLAWAELEQASGRTPGLR